MLKRKQQRYSSQIQYVAKNGGSFGRQMGQVMMQA
jgi:hypothetical protein